MLYQVKPTFGAVQYISDANAALLADALKNLIINDQVAFASSTAIDMTGSYSIYGEAPKKPYQWICSQTDPVVNGVATRGTRHWFKKEHPLYEGHFIYLSMGLIRVRSSYHAFQVTMAESVNADGSVIINETGPLIDANAGDTYWDITGSNPYRYGNINTGIYPIFNSSRKVGGYTIFISDWGLGVFGQSSAVLRTPSFGNYTGVLLLETLATKLDSDNPQAFIPKNYPMALYVASVGFMTAESGAWNTYAADNRPRYIDLMRFPKLESADVKALLTQTYLYSLGYSLNSSEGRFRDILGCDADGEDKAQVFPVYLNLGNAIVAKLPVLKPIIGSNKYTHVGKVIQSEGHNYFGIFALDKPCGCNGSELSNTNFQALRVKSANQEYLRMD
ncbi:hypothetical protein [Yersinia ruckeri]|uniref:hypothetical protein n=1 Tax=Yersinia ruckeri TaxID=29486 RepID=UPI002237A466|nr:hypothetical protein [Yersinia ruckeri]MCW6598849.1 hypothetical protein [Yersinia ruckeri]